MSAGNMFTTSSHIFCASEGGDAYQRHRSHPTGQPAMLVAIAAAFDNTLLEVGGFTLRGGAKPRVRMQQLAFVVYKVRTL